MTTTAVLFDLYNTLVGTDTGAIASGRRRGAELAGADPNCLQAQWTGSVDARSLGRLGRPRDELRQLLAACEARTVEDGVLNRLIELEAANWRHGAKLYDDVAPALAALRRDGCRLAIVSNCSWQTEGVLEATGLVREVEAVLLSYQVGIMKPDPAILRLAAERLGADPARTVLVDDVVANLDAARTIGMATVLVDRTGRGGAVGHRAVRDLTGLTTLLRARAERASADPESD